MDIQSRCWRGAWRGVAAACGLALAAAVPAHAADGLLDPSQALLARGEVQAAFEALDAQEATRAGEPAFDAAMGRAAYAAGHYSRAVLAWERALAARPDDADAARELVRALHAVGDLRGAQAVAQRMRVEGIPVAAALSIDQFLVSYDRQEHQGRSTWKGHAELSAGHDSNANAGPGLDAPALSPPGTPPWSLAPGAQAQPASFAAALAHVRGRHVLDARWSLLGAATAEARGYSDAARAYDSSQLEASMGAAYRRERQEWMLSAQGATYRLDGDTLRTARGLLGEWIYYMDGFRQWDTFLQVQDLRYPGQPLRDARRTVGGTSYIQLLRNGSLYYVGAYAGRETPRNEGVEYLQNNLAGLRAGVQWALAENWAAFTHVSHERRRYGASDPFFGVARHDRQTQWTLGLSWLPAPGWRVTPQWSWTRNASTLPITDYDRRVFTVAVRREF